MNNKIPYLSKTTYSLFKILHKYWIKWKVKKLYKIVNSSISTLEFCWFFSTLLFSLQSWFFFLFNGCWFSLFNAGFLSSMPTGFIFSMPAGFLSLTLVFSLQCLLVFSFHCLLVFSLQRWFCWFVSTLVFSLLLCWSRHLYPNTGYAISLSEWAQ